MPDWHPGTARSTKRFPRIAREARCAGSRTSSATTGKLAQPSYAHMMPETALPMPANNPALNTCGNTRPRSIAFDSRATKGSTARKTTNAPLMSVVRFCTAPPQRVPTMLTAARSAMLRIEIDRSAPVPMAYPLAAANSPMAMAIAAASVAMLPLRMMQNSAHAQLNAHNGP